MRRTHLAKLAREASLSPEQLGARMGVSGMTVRRWLARKNDFALEPLYESALRDAAYRLIAENKISADSAIARDIFRLAAPLRETAAFAALGLSAEMLLAPSDGDPSDHVLVALSKIGDDAQSREQTLGSWRSIRAFRRKSAEWSRRIEIVWSAARSKRLTLADKLPAFGALAYLLASFDLIPDAIPVFGLVDDFAVLGIAATFYAAKMTLASVDDVPSSEPAAAR